MADFHIQKVKDKYLVITPGDYEIDVINWKPIEDIFPEDIPVVEEHQTATMPATFTIKFLEEHPVINEDQEYLWDGTFLWNFTQGWKMHLDVDSELIPLSDTGEMTIH